MSDEEEGPVRRLVERIFGDDDDEDRLVRGSSDDPEADTVEPVPEPPVDQQQSSRAIKEVRDGTE